jgi:hypothetical protein
MPSSIPSITWWSRLEPRPRAPHISQTLAAPVRDACWMLTRQWMVGEFHGEDAGSQAFARLTAATSPFVGWRVPGDAAATALGGRPLEAMVEGEPLTPDLATRVELGATFLALLAQELAPATTPPALLAALRSRYPIARMPQTRRVSPLFDIAWDIQSTPPLDGETVSAALAAAFAAEGIPLSPASSGVAAGTSGPWLITDPATDRRYLVESSGTRLLAHLAVVPDADELRFRLLCSGRAIDGVALHLAGLATATPPPFDDPALTVAQRTAGERALVALRGWVTRVLGGVGTGDASAWRPEELEYRAEALATMAAGTLASLSVRPGREAEVDWHALDLQDDPATASGITPGAVTEVTRSVLPAHVRFRGMPNARWWDFERSSTDFGEVQPDKRDLAKLVVMDFMLVHGNDWFLIPFEQPVGTLCTIRSLVVHDVFGNDFLVERADASTAPGADAGEWTMFSTAMTGPTATAGSVAAFFVLPPGAGAVQVGPTLEEVHFTRDEMANMAWGVEQVTENALAEPWPAHEREAAVQAARQAAPADGGQRAGTAPLHYVLQTPVPEHWIPLVPVSLDPTRGEVAFQRAAMLSAAGGLTSPAGRILATTRPVREEAVPRIGVRVQRAVSRARWIDGTTHLWTSRRRRVSAGQGNSGLRFDQAQEEADVRSQP